MTIEQLRGPGPFSLEFVPGIPSLLLLLAYLGLVIALIWRHRDEFRALTPRQWIVLGVLLLLIPPAHRLMTVKWVQRIIIPPGPANVLPFTSAISLPGLAAVAGVAYVFGPGSGLIAGLIAGLTWARYTPLVVTDFLALSMWGYLLGAMLHQRYRGDIFTLLRQPLVATPLASLLTVALLSLSRLAATGLGDRLRIVDFMVILWRNELPLWLLVGVGLGGVMQLVALRPAWRLPQKADRPSFYSRSLSAQFMVFSIPLVLLSMLFSVLAVTTRSVNLARDQSLQEMRRSAYTASENIQKYFITGRSLIEAFAAEPQLLSPDPREQQEALNIALRVVPFYQQLMLVHEENGEFLVVASVPIASVDVTLTVEELGVLEELQGLGIGVKETRIMELPLSAQLRANGYSVVGCVHPESSQSAEGAEWFLIGRALFDVHPDIKAALSALQKQRVTEGGELAYEYTGYIVDSYDWIVAHPDRNLIRTIQTFDPSMAVETLDGGQGTVFETLTPEGEHILVYVHKLDGIPLRVVLELPYVTVLDTAWKTASALLIVQITFGVLLSLAIPILSSRMTRPLNSLAHAAQQIAQGNLDERVEIAGDDEVAQLGQSFEQMRIHLKARLNELSMLLDISQQVSATLDLERGVVPILKGALAETEGTVARFITLRDNGRPWQTYKIGKESGDLGKLDGAVITALSRHPKPLVVQDLSRALSRLGISSDLRSMAVFPVLSQGKMIAVLWVGVNQPGVFDEATINFLSTLASQAAILMENVRLFRTAEGGRQRLAAILTSTRDAILAVDADGHLLLLNPAAQHLFGIDRSAIGKPIKALGLPEPLTEVLSVETMTARRMLRYQKALPRAMRATVGAPTDGQPVPSVEVPLEEGRTFYASVAPIRGSEGLTLGVVAVLRDVTHFKELDEMKSEFVATVSHDLRSPLTSMRGYTTMLSMIGDLNDRQREYVQRILEGLQQMNRLVGDLLDLRRVESGVGLQREPCHVGLILIEAVEALRSRAKARGVTLRLEPSEGSPTVMGDRTLLRQAVSNLVDNAIKYTPSGGEVAVGLDIDVNTVTIRVSDTGIGIAAADQDRLFEKFYRIKRRETSNIQGTGLGLALVKSIVERHGGRVWVESELNKGSTFYIELPVPREELEEAGVR